MKKFLGVITAALLLILSGASVAATVPSSGSTAIDLSSLPQDQQDAIRQQVADAKKTASPVAQVQAVTDAASKWVEIGHAIGTTLVSTAQSLGVTANQFATTPVGKIIVAIVVWKYLAEDITHIGMGVVFLVLGVTLGLHFLRRASLRKVSAEEWSQTPVLWGLFTRRKLIRRDYDVATSLKGSEQAMQIAGYACLAIGVIICLALI